MRKTAASYRVVPASHVTWYSTVDGEPDRFAEAEGQFAIQDDEGRYLSLNRQEPTLWPDSIQARHFTTAIDDDNDAAWLPAAPLVQ